MSAIQAINESAKILRLNPNAITAINPEDGSMDKWLIDIGNRKFFVDTKSGRNIEIPRQKK